MQNLELIRKRMELEMIKKEIAAKKAAIASTSRGHNAHERGAGDKANARLFTTTPYHKYQLQVSPRDGAKPAVKAHEGPADKTQAYTENKLPQQMSWSPVSQSQPSSHQKNFERFLSILNKGVDQKLLLAVVDKTRKEVSNYEEQTVSNAGDSQNRNKDFCVTFPGAGQSKVSDKVDQPFRQRKLPHKADVHKTSNAVEKNGDGPSGSTSCAKKSEHEVQQYEGIHNLLQTIGLDLEVEEVNKLTNRTWERLYGKKRKTVMQEVKAPELEKAPGEMNHSDPEMEQSADFCDGVDETRVESTSPSVPAGAPSAHYVPATESYSPSYWPAMSSGLKIIPPLNTMPYGGGISPLPWPKVGGQQSGRFPSVSSYYPSSSLYLPPTAASSSQTPATYESTCSVSFPQICPPGAAQGDANARSRCLRVIDTVDEETLKARSVAMGKKFSRKARRQRAKRQALAKRTAAKQKHEQRAAVTSMGQNIRHETNTVNMPPAKLKVDLKEKLKECNEKMKQRSMEQRDVQRSVSQYQDIQADYLENEEVCLKGDYVTSGIC